MILAEQIGLLRGGRPLFSDASFAIHPGWHVGLTGNNGAGKSSLFSLLLRELQADTGTLSRPSGWVVAHMKQEVAAVDRSALDYVLDGDAEWRHLDEQLSDLDALDGTAMGNLFANYESIDGYTASSRASQLLAGLGFSESDMQRPVAAFSGGWRMRLNLAQTLMCRSDLLLLDEPTNHLDLDAILWLEDWLRAYPGTLLMVSHDRDFLDAVIEHILHVAQGTITHYRGNYSTFERTRAERLSQQQQAFDKQQVQVAHLQSFVDRFRAKATKAKQAQSRLKALERMTLSAPAEIESGLDIRFREPGRMASPLLRLDEAAIGHGKTPLISNVDLGLYPGARIGLLGPNGAGKTTLVRALVGDLPLISGTRLISEHTRIGYFAQHQVDHLDSSTTPLILIQRLSPKTDELTLRNFLGGFGFGGDRICAEITPFSGGEKARLALALIIWQRPNVLLLDEPTNHLDLALRHALLVAIQAFEGAIVLVSHDRHLVSVTCEELWLINSGKAERFDGDLDDYAKWLRTWRAKQVAGAAISVVAGAAEVASKPDAAEAEDKQAVKVAATAEAVVGKKPVRSADVRAAQKALEHSEQAMSAAHASVAAVAQQLSDAALYEAVASDELGIVLQQQKQAQQALEHAEAIWLAATEALETLNG
jgi:ATP-binding cassette subfamily F protein 3